MLGMREIRNFIFVYLVFALAGFSTPVWAQDPGNPDSLIIGNLDGTPILAGLNTQIEVPVYLKTDDSVAFMHLPIATNDNYITSRIGGLLYTPLSLWDDVSFLAPDLNSPSVGLTSQSILGFAFLFPPEDPQNYLYTNYQWLHIADFYMTTTDDISVLGDTMYIQEGLNPANGDILMGLPDGITVVIPQAIWGGIYFPPNNPPVVSEPSPGTYPINEQFGICLTVSATDADDDSMFVTVEFGPNDYTLEELINIPGEISYEFCWRPQSGSAGTYPLTITVNDGAGGVIDIDMTLIVTPTMLTIADDSSLPGSNLSLPVSLDNQGISSKVGAFEILIGWNPVALAVNSIIRSGRLGSWEYFNVNMNDAGEGTVRVSGIADLPFGGITPPLQPDTGTIFILDFSVSDDESLIGVDLPVTFINLDQTDNTLTDSTGYLLVHPDQTNGTISVIGPDDVLTGDINLNGIPYEAGDIVLFVNHLIDPVAFPFNSIQVEASDINADGIPETIADLVLLISIFNGTVPPPKLDPVAGDVLIAATPGENKLSFSAKSSSDIGGMLLKISHDRNSNPVPSSTGDFTLAYHDRDGILTIVAYFPEGGSVPAGRSDIFELAEISGEYDIIDISVSDTQGRLLNSVSRIEAPLPKSFELSQNYPNPFNANTVIGFALPEDQNVKLDIYNITGQKVGTLIDGYFEAGYYNLVWDGQGEDGEAVSSGIYLYKLQTDIRTITRKMTLLR